MIRWISFLLAVAMSTGVHADEMSDALTAQQKKDFSQAKQIFSKLAKDGNVKAQEELADMYWYGDGMPIDLAQAEFWFNKAAQGGSEKAKASLQVMKARVDRKQEIAYYTTNFDGGKLQFSNSGCTKPDVPAVSKTNVEIRKVKADVQAWSTCYNDYIKTLSTAPQGLAVVPQDLLSIMSDADVAAATVTIDKKMAGIVLTAKATAEEVNTKVDAWKKDTEAFVIQASGGKNGMSLEEFEIFQRNIRSQLDMYRAASPGASTPMTFNPVTRK